MNSIPLPKISNPFSGFISKTNFNRVRMVLSIALSLCFLLLLPGKARATHVMGADITYKCIDSLKFEFTIKYYRDCRGVAFSNPSSQTTIRCLTGGSQGVNLTLDEIAEITPVCASASGGCNPSNTRYSGDGIEQHTYKTTIDFSQSPYNSLISSGCCKLRMITQQCCRNGAINTGAANQNFYTYADIDLCSAPCNSSPSLTQEPIGILCCNQPFYYNNGAADTNDFDSLSYSWANPLTYNGANISYSGQYSYNRPFQDYRPGGPNYTNPNATPPIGTYLDPLTGDIIVTPTRCDEVTVAVIEVKEWRKDSTGTYKLIGTTRRDMQFITETCAGNNPPIVEGPYSYDVCAGSQLCFEVTTDDKVFVPPPPASSPPPDSVKISWNKGIPGATFTITNPTARLQSGQFCWTPSLDQASDLPYTFTVTARDNACRLNAVTVRGFRVLVKPRAQAERNIDTLPCGRYSVESLPIAGFKGTPVYRWQILDSNLNIVFDRRTASFASTGSFLSVKKSDSITFRKGGFYIIQHTINNAPQNCPNTYYDTLVVPEPFRADLSIGKDTFICAKTTLSIQPYIYNGGAPYDFQWATMGIDDDGNTLPNGVIRLQDTLPYYDLTLPVGQYDTAIALFARDVSGCTSVDTIRVFQKENPKVFLPEDPRICTYDSLMVIPTFDTAYWVDRESIDSLGNYDTVRQGDTLFKKWFLNGASSYFSEADSNNINIRGEYIVRVTDELGCYAEDTLFLNVNDTVKAFAGLDQELCYNDILSLQAQGMDTAGNGKSALYRWYEIRDNNTDRYWGKFTSKDTQAIDTTDLKLYLSVTEGGVQCHDSDLVHIDVNPLPELTLKPDFAVCCDYGIVDLNFNALANSDPKGGTWWVRNQPTYIVGKDFYPDRACMSTTNPVWVIYTYTHPTTGCVNSDSIRITVNPLPQIKTEAPTFCQDLGSFDMEDEIILIPGNTNNGTQEWECVQCNGNELEDFIEDELGGVGPSSFIVTISEPNYIMKNDDKDTVILIYTFTNAFGCVNSDTVKFYIIKVPSIKFNTLRDLCWDEGIVDLNDLSQVSPDDGVWTVHSGAAYRNANALGGITDSSIINTTASVELANASVSPNAFLIRYTHEATGCPISRDTTLVINPLPNITLSQDKDEACDVDDPINIGANPAGGTWTSSVGPNAFTGTPKQFNPQLGINDEEITLIYSYTNPSTFCESSDSITMFVESSPKLGLPDDLEFCRTKGESTILQTIDLVTAENLPADPADISWTVFTPNGASISKVAETTTSVDLSMTMSNDTIHTYYIDVRTEPTGVCPQSQDAMEIKIHPIPAAEILASLDAACNPLETDFRVDISNAIDASTATYNWNLGNGETSSLSNPFTSYNTDGTTDVSLVLTSAFGCDTTITSTVDVWPIPLANFTPDPNNFTTAALPRFKFSNQSSVDPILGSSIVKNYWDFGDLATDSDTSNEESPSYYYEADTNTYQVELVVETNFGCRDTFIYPVVVGPDLIVYIPNAFTPNNAGPTENDDFKAIISGEKSMELIIFDRWGEIMFRTTDKEDEWDGTYKGEPVQQDVYSYLLKATALNDEVYTYTGTITLIR